MDSVGLLFDKLLSVSIEDCGILCFSLYTYIHSPQTLTHESCRYRGEEELLAPDGDSVLQVLHLADKILQLKSLSGLSGRRIRIGNEGWPGCQIYLLLETNSSNLICLLSSSLIDEGN